MLARPTAAWLFALSLALAGTRALAEPADLEGKPAPDVALKTLDGKDIKLSDMKGSVVVMDFWATWCPPCRKSLPHIQEIATDKALADKGLVVWAVNAHEKADVVQKYLATNKLTFTVPMDDKGASMKQYQVSGIPTTVVVGRDGTVQKIFVGFGEGSAAALDAAVAAALKAEKPK